MSDGAAAGAGAGADTGAGAGAGAGADVCAGAGAWSLSGLSDLIVWSIGSDCLVWFVRLV